MPDGNPLIFHDDGFIFVEMIDIFYFQRIV